MSKATRWRCVGMAAIGSMLAIMAGSNRAQDAKPPEKKDDVALYNSLRIVIDTGAKIYNDQGDHAGCYRLYQGSLLAVKPFVTPELQKRIDEGIGNAEKMGAYADRAFELRKVLDEVRAAAKPGGNASDKKEDKKDDAKDKKQEEKDGAKDKIGEIETKKQGLSSARGRYNLP